MKKYYNGFDRYTQENFGKSGKFGLVMILIIILTSIFIARIPENTTVEPGINYPTAKNAAKTISLNEGKSLFKETGKILINHDLSESIIITNNNYLVKYPESYEPEFIKLVMDSKLMITDYNMQGKQKSGSTNRIIMFVILYGVLLISLFSRRKQKRAEAFALVATENKVTNATGELADYPETVFADVAGCTEAKEQLQELVEFLKNPEKYAEIGAKIPKGALLVGPPGTGKTLLARAIAGESKVPFFSASGSDFAEIYVGMGAKRVRELFKKAKEFDRSIIFIDEIDAIARHRSNSPHNQDSERENTLIALLTEMDGFDKSNTIVIAATNRADILDSAITRPGRLDRLVSIPLPDVKGRKEILQTHAIGKKLSIEVNFEEVARATSGFSGAELAMVLNEACINAVKDDRKEVSMQDINSAIADTAIGVARKSAIVSESDRKITAWHEAGHAIVAYKLADAPQPRLVSIVPRGMTGGVTWMEQGDNFYLSKKEAYAQVAVAMGGRVGEEILLGGEYTQGASSDLKKATEVAFAITNNYGMSSLGLTYRDSNSQSDPLVNSEIDNILNKGYAQAKKILTSNSALAEALALELLKNEEVSFLDIQLIEKKLKKRNRHIKK